MGIVSFSINFKITIVDTIHLFIDDRFQLYSVEHPQQFYSKFYILNIYAPANAAKDRKIFFNQITTMLDALQETIDFNRLIIAGDFNYSLKRQQALNSSTSTSWLQPFDLHFHNTMHMNDLTEIPTFQRTRGETLVTSVVDYIYLGEQLHQLLQDTSIHRIRPD